ncbi:hypothetical protein VNO78_11258 [Psophocarpus tetragonolobus]|uniref:Transmembrane protein n=1 Tax=Psophocarpus tetragonolobus TaxID=3891 RepID=A0AAN9XNG1_PSOTE
MWVVVMGSVKWRIRVAKLGFCEVWNGSLKFGVFGLISYFFNLDIFFIKTHLPMLSLPPCSPSLPLQEFHTLLLEPTWRTPTSLVASLTGDLLYALLCCWLVAIGAVGVSLKVGKAGKTSLDLVWLLRLVDLYSRIAS